MIPALPLHRLFFILPWGLSAAALALVSVPAAWAHPPGDGFKISGVLTAGTSVRTQSPDAAVLGQGATARLGLAPGELSGNAGASSLNFRAHRPVSTVLKGLLDLEFSQGGHGLALRARAWSDQELEHGLRPYGHAPNGFASQAPLNDRDFDARSRFTGAVVDDAYVFGRSALTGEASLHWRLGRQILHWGQARFFAGGVDVINPYDVPALVRPGVQTQEGRVPVGLWHGRLDLGAGSELQAWAQYDFKPTVLAGCGTFHASSNHAATGCNFVNVLGGAPVNLSDPAALASGIYAHRMADLQPSATGQLGVSLSRKVATTEWHGYLMSYHSRTPFLRGTNAHIDGGHGVDEIQRLKHPDGVRYGLVYPDRIHLLGLGFAHKPHPAVSLWGEFSLRPNQPLQINAADLIAAFVVRNPSSALNLARNTNALPPGASFEAYERHRVSTAMLGAHRAWAKVAGASRLLLSGELLWSHVAGLPDPGRLRFGRSDEYGVAAVAGGAACVEGTRSGKQCPLDGFVTSQAWGWRMHVAASYPGAWAGAMLTPSLTLGHDSSGYSHDGSLIEGRVMLRPAVRADWGKRYFAEMVYLRWQGGRYFTQVDRDTLSLSAGLRF